LICHVAPFRSSVTLFARFGFFQRHRFCGASRAGFAKASGVVPDG
jgi:hypothetical protein